MGINSSTMKYLAKMGHDGLFNVGERTVMELGSQDLHSYTEECERAIEIVFHGFGVANYDPNKVRINGPARHMYEALGFRYNCIDIDERPETLQWDLNTIQCPEEFRGKHLLTTNFGTTEHVIDQENCFRLIHDLTAVGGYMVHIVPCTGYMNHSFFLYSPLYFVRLAMANGYEMLYPCLMTGHGGTEIAPLPEVGAPYPSSSAFACVFRKAKGDDFANPYQTNYPYPMVWT